MGSRFPSHKLSNGLYVSGRPEQPKERTPTMSSVAMPYTGGDIKKSGELGKMFDIPTDGSKSRKSGPLNNAPSRTGSFGGAVTHSGPIMSNAAARAGYTTSGNVSTRGMSASASLKKTNSGPLNKHGDPVKKSSGPQSGGATRQNSGPIPPVLPATVTALFTWNTCCGRSAIAGFISHYPDAELRTAKNGQYVKVSGVVTCGNVPLDSSFQKVPRCVYTSTSLFEYRGWDSKAANPTHCHFTWGLRSSERHVVDFYISDFQSGLRALVKTGFGARVTPYVDDSVVIDVNPANGDMSPEFLRWLGERNLSSDDRTMRLKEGYIKEGSTASVMGVVQRNDNVLMIVPPPEALKTGCQWAKCNEKSRVETICRLGKLKERFSLSISLGWAIDHSIMTLWVLGISPF
ncbi:Ubiquitin-specific protease family C19 protein [Quillaja saponaria]|uniref:Ubiquitin-specific protease family C19 protein n=1 Tax=Quillaja saponaria TaxID=32244 RepID=A0AAD7LQU8_QUISA|nr:Ubiquitin-specific protease family C19 protein [Quillaja saponaria]